VAAALFLVAGVAALAYVVRLKGAGLFELARHSARIAWKRRMSPSSTS
jgi:hypothetical protein